MVPAVGSIIPADGAEASAAYGRTAIRVSRLGIGGGSLANAPGDDGVAAMIDAAWAAACAISIRPHSMPAAQRAPVRRRPGRPPPSEFTISTKAGRFVDQGAQRFDYSRAGITASIEGSWNGWGWIASTSR